MFAKFNSFFESVGPWLTFACFILYCILWAMGSTVEAWHVLPWILIVLITDVEDLVKRKIQKMTDR